MYIAIIPARGGSKRIPRKNIKDFNGRPLISYAITTALESKIFSDVLVSTEDEEIAAVARSCGASTPFMRCKELADDYTGTTAVGLDVYQRYQQQLPAGEHLDGICILYATTPLLTAPFLSKAFASMQQRQADYLFASCEFPFPVQRGFYINSTGEARPLFPECQNMRSQDLARAYQDAGQFYFLSARYCDYLLAHKDVSVFSDVPENKTFIKAAYEMPRYRVIDIDTPEDWEMALLMAQAVQSCKKDDQ